MAVVDGAWEPWVVSPVKSMTTAPESRFLMSMGIRRPPSRIVFHRRRDPPRSAIRLPLSRWRVVTVGMLVSMSMRAAEVVVSMLMIDVSGVNVLVTVFEVGVRHEPRRTLV